MLKSFKEWTRVFENLDNPVGIREFLENIEISLEKHDRIVQWWEENRSNIRVHYFRFTSENPIMGVFLGERDVAINSKTVAPGWMKLFLALHESRHSDQHREGVLIPGYWDTVVAEDEETFLAAYQYFEQDANDFAVQSMVEIGFEREMQGNERRLRGNEGAGKLVYQMMQRDIEKYQPSDLIDLFKMQIL
jgi:hypothetical protein